MTQRFVSLLKSMCQAVGLAAVAIAGAHATPTLTAAGASAGFGLSQFANNFPNNGAVGPLGIAFDGTKVLVSDYSGNVRIFATDADGQNAASAPVAQNYGGGTAGLTRSGNFFYLAQQNTGQVIKLNLNGTFNAVVATGIPTATGMFTNPVTSATACLTASRFSIRVSSTALTAPNGVRAPLAASSS